MVSHFIKVAWRSLWHYRMQSAISILGLSVGLLCFGFCLYIVRYIYSTNECFPNHNRIYEILLHEQDDSGEHFLGLPAVAVPEMERFALSGIELYTTVFYRDDWQNMGVESEGGTVYPYRVRSMEVDKNFADVFSCQFVYGDRQTAFSIPNAVVLTRSVAKKMFGEGNPVGEKIRGYIDEWRMEADEGSNVFVSYTVTAVIEDVPENTTLSYWGKLDLFFCNDSRGVLTNRRIQLSMSGCRTYALCRPGTDLKNVNRQIREKNITFNYYSMHDGTVTFLPMGKVEINDLLSALVWVLISVGALILLAALLNFYVFIIGQFLNREQEFAVRKSVGSDVYHLFGLLFSEITMILVLVLLVLFCLTEWICSVNGLQLYDWYLPLEKGVLMVQLFQYVGIVFILNIVIAVLAVWRIERMNMQKAFRKSSKRYVRNTVLAVQVFICFLFMGSAVVLKMQTDKMSGSIFSSLTTEQKKSIFSVSLEHPYLVDNRAVIIDKFRKLAHVEDVLESEDEITTSIWTFIHTALPASRDNSIDVGCMEVGPHFPRFFQLAVTRGREPLYEGEVLINSLLAESRDQLEVGCSVYDYFGNAYRISGIVEPFYRNQHKATIDHILIRCVKPENNRFCYIKATSGQQAAVLQAIDQVLSEFFPKSMPPLVRSLQEEIDQRQQLENSLKRFISFLSVVSLIITLLGIYSAVTLDTRRREKEVAIRKINGAGVWDLIWIFGRFYCGVLVGVAVLVLPILIFGFRLWLDEYAVSVSLGWIFMLVLFLSMALFIAMTVIFKILRVVRLNPADVLKNE